MPDRAVSVEIKGTRELKRGAGRLAGNIDTAAQAAFKQTADQAGTLVRSRVPHLTGRLAASVETDAQDHGALVGMGAGLPYAGWIEFGGGHGRPYIASGRYLYPTALHAGPTLQRAGEQAARSEIRRMAWPVPTAL